MRQPNSVERLIPIYGTCAINALQTKTVLIVGLGGVGSFAVEALARMHVGRFILVDGDVFEASNLNRQLGALHSTLGKAKTDVLKARILDINPSALVNTHTCRYNETTAKAIFNTPVDMAFDAIDALQDKAHLITTLKQKNIPFISAMGQGNRRDTNDIIITDLFHTAYDPLARKMRKKLREAGVNQAVPVVFNQAKPIKHQASFIASSPFSPPMAGLKAAEYIIETLIKKEATS